MNRIFNPGFSEPRFLVGLLLILLNSLTCLAQNPRAVSASSYLERGNEWQRKGELDRAIADFNIAIAFDPNFAGAYLNRGLAYQSKGNFQ